MRLDRSYTLKEVADILNAKFLGDGNIEVSGINEIHRVDKGDIAFVDHPKYYKPTLESEATIILIDQEQTCPAGKGLIILDQPFTAFNRLLVHFNKQVEKDLSPSPQIGNDCDIADDVVIGKYVKIGDRCTIKPGVVIYDHSEIGNDVIIQANAVIGSDGFYFKKHPDRLEKFICVGKAVIKDHVEIGANCTIDRGVTSDTTIGRHTKLDNMVHIGHDSTIGERCLFAAQVAVAGFVTLEDEVTMWGQSAIAANLTLGKGAIVLAQSGVTKSLPGNKGYFGNPAKESRQRMRELATLAALARRD